MKFAAILMSLVFAGVVAQANEPAPATKEAPAATHTEETKEVKTKKTMKKGKHAPTEAAAPAAPAAAPAGH